MNRLLPSPPPLVEGKARIYVYRLGDLWGAALWPRIRLDGVAIGKSIAGRYVFEDVEPGSYELTVRMEVKRSLAVRVSAGETLYIRVSPVFGWIIGRFKLEAVAPETAAEEMRDLVLLDDRASGTVR